MFLQKPRTAGAYALCLSDEDQLSYVHLTVVPAVGESFGEVLKMDRRENNGEAADVIGALAFPGFVGGVLEEETPSKEQSSPGKGRKQHYSAKRPYKPRPRPKIVKKAPPKR